MKVSVILSTYQQQRWLELTLCGYAKQSFEDFEIIIADDGSDASTKAVIEQARNQLNQKIVHVWHPDNGFRKCQVLNRAISAASGDYLIFSDGDCTPCHDFVSTHLELAQPSRFLSGGTLRLSSQASEQLSASQIDNGLSFDAIKRAAFATTKLRSTLRMCLPKFAAGVADRLTITKPTFNGHNASCWREDVLRVNGFDERMVYGGLDRELGERLSNAGVLGLQIRHRAICVHLYHDRPYATSDGFSRNRRIRHTTRSERLQRTPYGIHHSSSMDLLTE